MPRSENYADSKYKLDPEGKSLLSTEHIKETKPAHSVT